MTWKTNLQSDIEETVLVPQPASERSRTAGSHPHIQLITGSNPQMRNETRALLRVRLEAVATIFLMAECMFYIRSWFLIDQPVHSVFHAFEFIILCGSLLLLWKGPPLSLLQLRVAEVGLFAMASLFLAVYQYRLVLIKAVEGDPIYELAAIKSCVVYFFGLILLYGMFIPNTWKRAACVVFPMMLVPGVVMAMLVRRSDAVESLAKQIANFEQVSDHVVILMFGAISSVYGAHIINTLRNEAFRARQLGQYRLKERIGAGGMGEVYLAEHQLLKRPCAIKLIRASSAEDPNALARFEREVRTTAKLSHWNTIHIFDYGHTDDGTFYYVMEYLPGLSLADLVKRYGPMPASRVIHLLRQACHALREAHAVGLVHRDIKPANIFAAQRGGLFDVAKLLDFGLVKQTREDQGLELTREGRCSGSPLYMSPEQATAVTHPDARSDIYSMGATAYYLLTGQTPFTGSNPIQVMVAHARDPVTPPSHVHPDVPLDVERVVMRCLAKEPGDRFPDAVSLDMAFAECADSGAWTDADANRWWHDMHETGQTEIVPLSETAVAAS